MVYTISMMKKKKSEHEEAVQTPQEESDTSSSVPVVTQVVEVVDEKSEGTTIEEVDNLDEQEQAKSIPSEPSVDEKASTQESEAKSKEVVQELFSKREPESITEISIHRKKRSRILNIWAIIVIVAAITSGFGLLLANKKVSIGSLSVVQPAPTPTPPAGAVATPTTAPQLSREDISVQVLNGGGVPGAASKMKNILVEKGYTVSDIGNTEEYTYAETEIIVKSDKAEVLQLLKDDLKDSYTIGTTAATLSGDASYDARVIVGKE